MMCSVLTGVTHWFYNRCTSANVARSTRIIYIMDHVLAQSSCDCNSFRYDIMIKTIVFIYLFIYLLSFI